MVHSIGRIPGIVVIIVIISVVNHGRIAMITITTVVIVIIMTIDSHCHDRKCGKIGRIISVIIWWIIGHIGR
jgi:hypothetical protein